jgi:hypothetical protein
MKHPMTKQPTNAAEMMAIKLRQPRKKRGL